MAIVLPMPSTRRQEAVLRRALVAAVANTDPARRSPLLQVAAEAVVALRQCFPAPGQPDQADWGGRSGPYRDAATRIYRQARVPPDSAPGNFQSSLRYHVGNRLRQVAPASELEAQDLDSAGPVGRLTRTRAQTRAERQEARHRGLRNLGASPPAALAPEALARLALEAVRALASTGQPVSEAARDTLLALVEEAWSLLRPGPGS